MRGLRGKGNGSADCPNAEGARGQDDARGGSDPSQSVELTAPMAVRYLHPELRSTWADLNGAPRGIAEATAQLLPFGSRAALETLGLAEPGELLDEHGHRKLRVTPFGFAVMAEAAAEEDLEVPSAEVDWTQRANEALQHLEAASQRES